MLSNAYRKLTGWVRTTGRSRPVMVGLVAVVALAVAGTTYGYSSLNTSVTLSLDGTSKQVTARADTVGEVLAAEGITVGEHDLVAPSLNDGVVDGSRISVRFGRPLELTVDGNTQTHWVTSTDVAGALDEIGRTFASAELSTSRGGNIDREGMILDIVTPKTLELKIGAQKVVTRKVIALTVEEALDRLGVKVGTHDTTKPALGRELVDGDRVVFTNIRIVKKRVAGESLAYRTVERADDSLYEGETSVSRSGADGLRNVTYRQTFRNGKLVVTKVLHQKVLRASVDEILNVGTRAPVAATNFASGGTVWDSLAQCESGGNWAINTGNGYYGGLQFNLGTWQSYGGSGLPSNNSREEQIRVATLLRDASGGYGAWPGCAASLGLPR